MREPLGLPRGSVRGLLAVMVIGTMCAMFLLGRDVPEALIALAGAVMPYYFLQRQVETRRADEVAAETPEAPDIPGSEPVDPPSSAW